MFAVMKKELKSYLLSPIGYIFIGLFLLIFSIFFYSNIFLARTVRFEFLFADGATILTFVIPLLTMRMFSEERKNGTEQLLLTSPRSIFSIVFGKLIVFTLNAIELDTKTDLAAAFKISILLTSANTKSLGLTTFHILLYIGSYIVVLSPDCSICCTINGAFR